MGTKNRRLAAGFALPLLAAAVATARLSGYSLGLNTVVRCRQGHLFTTIWIPGVSVKALRLGRRRFQRCPVGRHWTLVVPVADAELSEEDRKVAAAHRDVRIP